MILVHVAEHPTTFYNADPEGCGGRPGEDQGLS